MNSEALRLLEKIRRDVNDVMNNTRTFSTKDAALTFIMADIDQLRAVVSAPEPTAEHWRRAIRDWYGTTRAVGLAWDWIEQRARELAKQEAK